MGRELVGSTYRTSRLIRRVKGCVGAQKKAQIKAQLLCRPPFSLLGAPIWRNSGVFSAPNQGIYQGGNFSPPCTTLSFALLILIQTFPTPKCSSTLPPTPLTVHSHLHFYPYPPPSPPTSTYITALPPSHPSPPGATARAARHGLPRYAETPPGSARQNP